jgi:outer membrane protein OmpU
VNDTGTVGLCFNEATDTISGAAGGCLAAESELVVPAASVSQTIPSGSQWSGSIGGTYGDFGLGIVYTTADSDSNQFVEGANFDTLGAGATFGWEALTVGGYYLKVLDAGGDLEAFDGEQTYGVTAAYDLGGGASVAGGVASTLGRGSVFGNRDDGDAETVADFGIKMSF